jgi:hypothetical protein
VRHALQGGRREGEAHGAEVRLRDHCQPERIRQPLAVGLPSLASTHIVSISDSNWSAGLTSQRKCLALAGVPEAVGRARLDRDDISGTRENLPVSDAEAEPALNDLETLALKRVDVRCGDETVRAHDRLQHHRVAVTDPRPAR